MLNLIKIKFLSKTKNLKIESTPSSYDEFALEVLETFQFYHHAVIYKTFEIKNI